MKPMTPTDITYLLNYHQTQIDRLTENLAKLAQLANGMSLDLQKLAMAMKSLVEIVERQSQEEHK